MEDLRKKSLIKMMEGLSPGESALFQMSETYGGDLAIIELNPRFGEKKEDKYHMWLGKTEEKARSVEPYWSTSKAKQIAAWIADRSPSFIEFKKDLKEAV